ncbi:MAG: response regulator [Herpetosiphonaceae bacterium]|nr:response regulator [Herpetosiphonaceae bacterium]
MVLVKLPILLLITAEPEFVYLIKRYGEWSGCRVISNSGVDEALAAIIRERPAMVFLHLLWGSEGGWSSLRRLKQHAATCGIPITIISSVADEARARAEGADYWLWQPVMYADFRVALVATHALPAAAGEETDRGGSD